MYFFRRKFKTFNSLLSLTIKKALPSVFLFTFQFLFLSCSSPKAVVSGKKQVSANNAESKTIDTSTQSTQDKGSSSDNEVENPKIVGTLSGLTKSPNLTITAAPIDPELLDPTIPSTKHPSLYGEWVGQCMWSVEGEGCDQRQLFVNQNRTCPQNYIFVEYTNQLSPNDKLKPNGSTFSFSVPRFGTIDWSSQYKAGTCVYQGERTDDQKLNPQKYALAGSFYGLCISTNSEEEISTTCDGSNIWPMQVNRTCPAGFQFVQVASGLAHRVGTCMLPNDTKRPASIFPGALSGLCTYSLRWQLVYPNDSSCKSGVFGAGAANARMKCAPGFTPFPFGLGSDGNLETWSSSCVRN
jgi:hypothetical protein